MMGEKKTSSNMPGTSLGIPEKLPSTVRVIFDIITSTPYPMFLIWGAEKIFLFNDAFDNAFDGVFPVPNGGPIEAAAREVDPALLRAIDQAFGGQPEKVRIWFSLSGKQKNVQFHFLPIVSETENIIGIYGNCKLMNKPASTEKHLRDALDLAEKTIDTVRSPSLILTKDLRVKSANSSFYKNFEVTAEETIGQLVYNLGNGQWNIPELKELLENTLARNEVFDDYLIEHNFEKLGQRTMLLNGRRINHMKLILLAIDDITENKKASDKLRSSEEKYRSLFNSIDEGFCIIEMIFDKKGAPVDYRFLETNPAFEKQTRLKDAVGKTMREMVPEHEEHWFKIYGNVVKTGKSIRFINEANALIGGWYEVYAFPYGGAGSDKLAVVFNDITHKKKADENLRRSQEHLRLILESARDYAILTMDKEKNITDWNAGAENLLGYKKEEILGQKADIIFVPEERSYVPDQEVQLAKINGSAENERWHLRKDGTRFWGSGLTMTLKNAEGNLRGFLKIMKDDTERIKMQKALEESKNRELKLIKSENQRKDEFMNIASHELKTPLTSLKAYAQLLLENLASLDEPTQRKFLGKIDSSVNRLSQLISDLLEVTRINSGKIVNQFEKFDISSMIRDSIEMAQQNSEKHQITFEGDEVAEISGDRNRLHQVVDNLISNAVKYSPNGGKIMVKAEKEKDTVHVTVVDSGIGIPEEEFNEIFKPYSRVNMKYKISGLGLGLFICSEIIKDHDGKIWVESELDKGSVFHFIIPMEKK